MNPMRNSDRLSSLSDMVLVSVISNLPYKEAVKTSVLANRWKNLYRESTNISFKESEFVKSSVSDDDETKRNARVSFVTSMVDWVSTFSGDVIENFEICLSKPMGFETEIKSVIEFAVSKQVKNLVLEFSDPSWVNSEQAAEEEESVFQLPECVYKLSSLESLKLFACGFDPTRFSQAGSLKSLCFGWIELGKIMALLTNSPLLESLSIQNCWNVGLEAITEYNNRVRELVFENCGFATESSSLDLPNIQIFKYSGKVHHFQFVRVNKKMEEAYFDFGAETEQNEGTGTLLCDLLCNLSSAKKLRVCPFLIQAIKEIEDPVQLQVPMETTHLIIRTTMEPEEFVGTKLMINSCPDLETLTLDMIFPSPDSTYVPDFNPDTYWSYENTHECLNKSLKVVQVKNFVAGSFELHILKFLIRWGLILERVDLYLPSGLHQDQKTWVSVIVRHLRDGFEATSDLLWIRLHDT